MRTRVRKAFTLVEILIVVVILGILAAIVVPQFTGATDEARGGNIQSQLDTLNNQIELYKARNNGNAPDLLGTGWVDLVTGNYIKADPSNPACEDPTVRTVVEAAAADSCGWVWDGTDLTATYFNEATGKVTPGVP